MQGAIGKRLNSLEPTSNTDMLHRHNLRVSISRGKNKRGSTARTYK